jgi:hypothetical protein
MKTTLAFLLLTVSAVAQDSESFKKRYGRPSSETYVVRPEVSARVKYSTSGDVCELLLLPDERYLRDYGSKRRVADLLNEIVDEMIPQSDRGGLLRHAALNVNCIGTDTDCQEAYSGELAEYERVTILRNFPKSPRRFALVRWKTEPCSK